MTFGLMAVTCGLLKLGVSYLVRNCIINSIVLQLTGVFKSEIINFFDEMVV
jgi:hypothetical protein